MVTARALASFPVCLRVGILFTATAPLPAATALPLSPRIQTIDLSDAPVETVIPAEFDGGFFARIGQLIVGDRGMWISDPGHTKVWWFGPEGDLRAEYGRAGNGPGEFPRVGGLRVDSVVTVLDPLQFRTVRFALDGSHLETISQRQFVSADGYPVALLGQTPMAGGFTVGQTLASYRFGTDDPGDPFQHGTILMWKASA